MQNTLAIAKSMMSNRNTRLLSYFHA